MTAAIRCLLHLVPSLEGGGAERQLTMLAIEQVRRGCDVHVGVRRGGIYVDLLRAGGAKIHFLGDYRGADPRLLLSICRLIRETEPEIVQTWLPQMDIIGGMAALLNSVHWVVSERASAQAYHDRPAYYGVRRQCVRRSDAVVANSTLGMDYWRVRLPASVPAFRISNAIDIIPIRSAMAQATTPNPLGEGEHFISVGRVTYQKAPDVILAAARHLISFPTLRVHLIGEGELREEVETAIRNEELTQRVELHPYRHDWWSLLRHTRALISASRFEGQPNVVLEAMAAGCPLIATDIPEHREFLDAQSALLVPVNDPVALASAIASVLSDPDAARRRAERAANRVADMSVAVAADAYESVYQVVSDQAA